MHASYFLLPLLEKGRAISRRRLTPISHRICSFRPRRPLSMFTYLPRTISVMQSLGCQCHASRARRVQALASETHELTFDSAIHAVLSYMSIRYLRARRHHAEDMILTNTINYRYIHLPKQRQKKGALPDDWLSHFSGLLRLLLPHDCAHRANHTRRFYRHAKIIADCWANYPAKCQTICYVLSRRTALYHKRRATMHVVDACLLSSPSMSAFAPYILMCKISPFMQLSTSISVNTHAHCPQLRL